MVTHVVMFKLHDFAIAAQVCERLQAMAGRIPGLREVEAGVDTGRSQRAYDVVLITRFDTADDLATYRSHPVHQEVVAYLTEVSAGSAVVDFVA